jgi:Fe-S oxidoreductase
MCPTYRASEEEVQSTRGRANMLRGAISGELPDDPTDDEFVTEVMDLCVGCKGCKVDCPSGVDMAKLKAEVEHAHHEEHGIDLRTRLLGRFESLAPLASRFAPLSNLPNKIPGSGLIAEKALGIARERDLPEFRSETLVDWFEARGGAAVPREEADRDVLLFPDVYTTYTNPGAGKAAVRVLEAANCHVEIPDVDGSGRPPHSKGMLDVSRATARDAVETLAPRVRDGWEVVVVEPSDAVMLQSDYHDLLDGDASDVPDADVAAVSEHAYGIMEYVDAHRLDEALALDAPTESLTYHGHCHQKATKKDHHAVGVLRRAGYGVDPLDSSCCGMAGSFGYEAEHYSMSKAIGETLFEQVDASGGDALVAPGTSCRTQLEEGPGEVPEPSHPVEKLAAALA